MIRIQIYLDGLNEDFKYGNKIIGGEEPAFIIAEIGINHNGDMKNVFKLIDLAKDTGCDAVKFQKRTPELAVPKDQWDVTKDTPWGLISYIDYKNRIELSVEQYKEIDKYCSKKRFYGLLHVGMKKQSMILLLLMHNVLKLHPQA